MTRPKSGVFFAFSGAVHAALIAYALLLPRALPRPQRPPPPLSFLVASPPLTHPAVEVLPTQAQPVHVRHSVMRHSKAAPASLSSDPTPEPASSSPVLDSTPTGPRALVTLGLAAFHEKALSHRNSEPDASASVAHVIANGWLNQGVGKGRAPRGALIGFSKAIRAQLENSRESIQSEETRAPAAYLQNELEGRLRPDATRELRENAAPAGREVFDMTRDGLKAQICFGACGQTHLTHKMHVDIEVTHGEKGQMLNAVLLHPSASASFDDLCLKIVNSVVGKNIETSELAPLPTVSVWRFERSVLRFSAVERFLDPAFRGSADAQVVTSVNLLSAKYASKQ